MNGKLRTDIGLELDAKASLSQTGDRYHLTFESSGESGRRNGDYTQAFELALRRLASLGAVLHDGRVESRKTRNWDPNDKRLIVDYAPYPVRLSRVADIARLAKDLRTAGAKVGRTAVRGGNPTKRLTLDLSLPASFVGGLAAAARALFGTARPPGAGKLAPNCQVATRTGGFSAFSNSGVGLRVQ